MKTPEEIAEWWMKQVYPALADWVVACQIRAALNMPADDTEPLVPFKLRMREHLRQRIEDQARANGNSMNTEITNILIESYRQEDQRMQDQARAIKAEEDLAALAQRVRVLDAALSQLLEVMRDIITDDDLEPGLMAMAKKALEQAEEAQQLES